MSERMPGDAPVSAHTLGLYGCHCCGLVSQADGEADLVRGELRCPRCGVVLHARRPQSVALTLGFLAGATALYLPANLLPVMSTASLFGRQEHTLLGGIADLWRVGSFELAVIVFIASIAHPEDRRARAAGAERPARLDLAPAGARPPAPPRRGGGALVDARHLRGRAAGGHAALRLARQREPGAGAARLRRGRGVHHPRVVDLRPAADLAHEAALR
jgi:hypothetical protein